MRSLPLLNRECFFHLVPCCLCETFKANERPNLDQKVLKGILDFNAKLLVKCKIPSFLACLCTDWYLAVEDMSAIFSSLASQFIVDV